MRFRGKKRNKERLLATFVTSKHFQIKRLSFNVNERLSVKADNDVLKAT